MRFWRRHSPTLIRYYVYVSDSKVDMLFDQIPSRLQKRLSAELKLSLKVVSLSLKDNPRPDTRYSKLAVVREFILRELPVGTVDEPDDYFRGELDMHWDTWAQEPGLVYFSGMTPTTAVGLGGSAAHIVGGAPVPGTSTPSSSARMHITRALSDAGREQSAEVPSAAHVEPVRYPDQPPEIAIDESMYVANMVVSALRLQQGPEERLEFLARRLVDAPTARPYAEDQPGRQGRARGLLGSPIYVAYPPTAANKRSLD